MCYRILDTVSTMFLYFFRCFDFKKLRGIELGIPGRAPLLMRALYSKGIAGPIKLNE